MNKKFSTLVASVLLAAGVGNANAAVTAGFTAYPGPYTAVSVTDATTAFQAGYAKSILGKGYFQLGLSTGSSTYSADGDGVLAMIPNSNGTYSLKIVKAADQEDLRYTLWTIRVLGNLVDGYRYSYINLGTNQVLSFSSNDVIKAAADGSVTVPTDATNVIAGGVADWKWVDAPDPVGGFRPTHAATLWTAFGAKKDSVMTLAKGATSGITAVKYALNNKPTSLAEVKVVPVAPKAVVLQVNDLNSMLWTGSTNGKLKLTFTPDVNNNEFANVLTQNLKAESAVGYPFRNFKWDLPAYDDTKSAGENADAMEDALLKYNQLYKDLNAYEVAQHQATFANAVKAQLGTSDANKGDINTFLGDVKTAVATDYATSLIAVGNLATSDKAYLASVKTAVIAFIKSEMPNVMNNGNDEASLKSAIEDVIDEIANKSTSEITAYVTGLALDAKKDAANEEKENVRPYWDAQGWVSLKTDAGKYIMVDTAYMTSDAGDKYLKISDDKTFKDLTAKSNGESISPISWTREDINGRFNFQFVYHPYQDSIVIRSAGFATLADGEVATSVWKDLSLPETVIPGKTIGNNSKERNLVKIQVLGNSSHRELTIGNSEYDRLMNPTNTINTRISINGSSEYVKTTLPSGVYFMNLFTNDISRKQLNGKFNVIKYCGEDGQEWVSEEVSQLFGAAQDFGHMPRAQWVVEQNEGISGEQTINIVNREYPEYNAKGVQLYQAGDKFFALYSSDADVLNTNAAIDTVSFSLVSKVRPVSGVNTNKYLGYFQMSKEDLDNKVFNFDYFSGIKLGNYVNVSSTERDTTVFVDFKDQKTYIKLVPAPENYANIEFGYPSVKANAPQLYKNAYVMQVFDGSKLTNDLKYVVRDQLNEMTYAVSNVDKKDAVVFFLKENNQLVSEAGDTTCYYVLQEANKAIVNAKGERVYTADDQYRVGVRDVSGKFTMEGTCDEVRLSTFALNEDLSPLYRRLGVSNPDDNFADLDTARAKIYTVNSTAKEYLYEDAYSKYSKDKGINFLGLEGKGDNAKSALFIDTAYVRNNTNMPQYMIAVDVTHNDGENYCPYDPYHNSDEYLKEHPEGCPHAIKQSPFTIGRYLINSSDSIATAVNGKDYVWNTNYKRLNFVWAKHVGDTLVILRGGKDMDMKKVVASDSIFLGDNLHNTLYDADADYANAKVKAMHSAHKNGIKNAVFAFRLVDDKKDCDFLIESEGNHKIPTPERAGWVKIQNGVPVIANYPGGYKEAITDAEIFNIEPTTETPTANEGISTSEVSIVAGNGVITIKGAAGKTVAISNILGQTIANTILSSDDATIAAPAGVAVVAVEGEAAVKAIVK